MRISVVAPMLNEAAHVERLVEDLAAQDFAGELEIFVADGGSTDGSVARLRGAAARAGLDVTVVANPARWVSHGLNECVRRASGDLIVRVDCHSRYPADYLRRCALAAAETGAWNVGGLMLPEGRTATERAVACAMASPFGGVAWTRRAGSGRRVDADTVAFGAFRPEAFVRVGLFDESLVRNQDDELNLRIRRAGGRVVLDPSIRVRYRPRGSFRGVLRQYYEYGLWKVPVMLKHRRVVSGRSMAPLALLASFAGLTVLAAASPAARRLLALEVGLYGASAAVAGAASVRAHAEPWSLLPRVVAVFPAFHLAYGAGMLHGWLRAARSASGARPSRPPSRGRRPGPGGGGA